jgi:hypothetical protein
LLIAQWQKKMSFYMQCLGDEAIVPSHADSPRLRSAVDH